MDPQTDPAKVVRALAAATSAHDLEALVACFADDYRNETPVHPARGFRGATQVRRNWAQLFAGIPDLTARVVASATAGDTVWSEWEMSGARQDGTPHLMRGVIIFVIADGHVVSARFYLEPVDRSGTGVDEAVARTAGTSPAGILP
ncbi:nuclear transport factor 2 family protein [Microbacterium panaciterrae]|uniref:SnoaL-like domain-containing protein n=1 Tax=Microbacterium panaciterrae TaxID=985759 RepID=A0ABP8PA49_9MICO